MWDVKCADAIAALKDITCFTLTMWDVKEPVTIELTFEIEKFYLNYVGCKENSQYQFVPKISCFTLTMWDVKRLKLGQIL